MKHSKQFTKRYISLVAILALMFVLSIQAYAYERISNRENSVRIDVIPIQLTFDQPAIFEVRLNTHSVNLSQDLVTVSTLTDSNGKEYLPAKWDGSPTGGHHRSGILEFPTINGKPESVTLTIREIASVPERTFTWKISR